MLEKFWACYLSNSILHHSALLSPSHFGICPPMLCVIGVIPWKLCGGVFTCSSGLFSSLLKQQLLCSQEAMAGGPIAALPVVGAAQHWLSGLPPLKWAALSSSADSLPELVPHCWYTGCCFSWCIPSFISVCSDLLEGDGFLKGVAWGGACQGHFDIITVIKTILRSHVKQEGNINHSVHESLVN